MSGPPPLRFILDAQLPRRLAQFLAFHAGCDCLHTLDLPEANRTEDGSIARLSMQQERIVISKDADFVNTFLLHGQPYKLLLLSTGNISTNDLLELFRRYLPQLLDVLRHHSYVELSRTLLVTHR